MSGSNCPSKHELEKWLLSDSDAEPQTWSIAHLDTCGACRERLESLDSALRDRVEWIEDIKREQPPDPFESEPECASASIRAAAGLSAVRSAAREADEREIMQAITRRGRYEVLEVLGRGGMGIVYRARSTKLSRPVAIKVLPSLRLSDAAAVRRFDREMRAIARLSHPNIVTAYDADEVDGKHFLVMEIIDGADLKTIVAKSGPLPVRAAIENILQAARGLAYAHEQGIVHRDVKPANLMLDKSGTVRVLDLGLARFEADEETPIEITQTGFMMGTIDYMAPEQAAGARGIDGRADIYSLGCSLYYLLTGRPIYAADSVVEKVLAHRQQPIPKLSAARYGCPASLDHVFAKMVGKKPEDRYARMSEVIADLEKVLEALPRNGKSTPPADTTWATIWSRRNLPWAMGGAAVLAAIAFVLIPWGKFTRVRSSDQPAPNRPATRTAALPWAPFRRDRAEVRMLNSGEELKPGEWYDLLSVTPLTADWKRTEQGVSTAAPRENSLVQVPLVINGTYQLHSSFTRRTGDQSVNYYFPVQSQVGILYLDIDDINSLVIDGKHGGESTCRSELIPLASGRRYELDIYVTPLGDEALIEVDLDGERHLRWHGLRSALPDTSTSGRFAIGSRDGDTIFHDFHVRLIDGIAYVP